MNKILNHAVVSIGTNGRVMVVSDDFATPEVKEMLEMYSLRKVAGRSYFDKNGFWLFDPYNQNASVSKIYVKEMVGQIQATRSANAIKFSLSLPSQMTKHQVVMSVIEQYNLLIDALQKEGLYERLKMEPKVAEVA